MITKVKTSGHQEWLDLRSQYIGGSDAAAVLGLNPYKSPYALWAEKSGRVPPFGGSIATRVGTQLEGFVAKLYEEQTGNAVRNDNATYLNDTYPWACANIDRRITGKKAGLEIKTTNDYGKIKRLRDGKIPNDWLCQMTHYMAVTGWNRWDLAALAENRNLYVLTMERNEDDIFALMQAENEFWQCVQSNTAPGVDGSQSTTDAIEQMYPGGDVDTSIALDPVASELENLVRLKTDRKKLDTRIKESENAVKAYMGDNISGAYGSISVSWKSVSRSEYDTKALKKDHPDMMKQYKNTSASRRFTVKEV